MWRQKDEACYVEEVFLINLYGSPEETSLLEKYLQKEKVDKEKILNLASSIKKRVVKK